MPRGVAAQDVQAIGRADIEPSPIVAVIGGEWCAHWLSFHWIYQPPRRQVRQVRIIQFGLLGDAGYPLGVGARRFVAMSITCSWVAPVYHSTPRRALLALPS